MPNFMAALARLLTITSLGIGFALAGASVHQAVPRFGRCNLAASGSGCAVQQSAGTKLLGTHVGLSGDATPKTVALGDQVWLRVWRFPAGEPVSVTLSAPDGTVCEVQSSTVVPLGELVQAFVIPASCADALGIWVATFSVRGLVVSAPFSVVEMAPP